MLPWHTCFNVEANIRIEGDIKWYSYYLKVQIDDHKPKKDHNPRGDWGEWNPNETLIEEDLDDDCRRFRTAWVSQDREANASALFTDNSSDSDNSPKQSLCEGCWQEGVDHKVDCPCGTPYYTCRSDHVDEHGGHEANNQDHNSLGISSTDPNQQVSPGESYEVRLVTDTHYYWVDWYVKAPWETSERGSHIEGVLGDGSTTEATFSYTFPSGSMHTGDFLITAVIYRGTDMSEYEETYTVTVSSD